MIRVPFVFDPPLALPHRGTYAMFLQAASCFQGEPWLVMGDTLASYVGGTTWFTGRSVDWPCPLIGLAGGHGNGDFCFQIDLCADVVTEVKRRSWGRLKLLYR